MNGTRDFSTRLGELVGRATYVGSVALWSPSKAFALATPAVVVCILALCVLVQAGMFSLIPILRPSFVVALISERGRVSAPQLPALVSFALNRAASRAATVVWSTATLSAALFFLGQFVKRRARLDSLVLGSVGGGILATCAWYEAGPFGHSEMEVGLSILGIAAMGFFLQVRQEDFGSMLAPVVLAGVTSTAAFAARFLVSIYSGYDTGQFSLVGLVSRDSSLVPWLARVDVFDLWWCVVVSGGLARSWARSYRAVLVMMISITLCFMLFYRA